MYIRRSGGDNVLLVQNQHSLKVLLVTAVISFHTARCPLLGVVVRFASCI